MNRIKGFSLTEILSTMVILAVLAAIAIPGFSKAKDKAAAAQAVAYLRALRLGEKLYFAKNAAYVACTTTALIKSNLGVEVTTENYTFDVTAPTPATGFIARALKGSAAPTDCTATDAICVDQDGGWTENSAYVDGTKL